MVGFCGVCFFFCGVCGVCKIRELGIKRVVFEGIPNHLGVKL